MRMFRDRDFIRTREDFFFCVVGLLHPSDRIISYLKYIPSKLGIWGRGERRFKRILKDYTIPSLLKTFSFLERNYPHYLFYSPYYGITMSAVPQEYVVEHYKPEEKLAYLLHLPRHDSLQEKSVELASFLSDVSGVPLSFFGISGSILLDIHNPEFSDIDMVVYGLKNSLAVKSILIEAYSSPSSAIRRFKGEALRVWCERKTQSHPLTFDETLRIYDRKWNIGLFDGTRFSIHPVKLEHEVKENYGDKICHPLAPVVIQATVRNNSESLFLPSIYEVEDVKVMEGPQVADIQEVVSYEDLYGGLAEVGESIVVRGKLERVLDRKTGEEYHRVLVGSPEGKGMEYIKLA